ncbi:hypothetical protein BaRGS_00010971 [Batillaria attramentaria]|uniref:Chitin-binding type-4 domain-containing protein n=1 Tax=Batillaria attramentaria TaxID=370345 RepID=A0ABD0LE49_9CAEN
MVMGSEVVVLLLVATGARFTRGHGRLLEPPSRSSMWRFGFNTTRNYNDNSLNCGGLYTQWFVNQGKCGVCGDPWNQPVPRDNEAGGRYGKGIITRAYKPGQEMNVRVEITANHAGWFEFRLCPHNDPSTPVTQRCLDQHLLGLADGSGTRYQLVSGTRFADLTLTLPPGLTCSQCVLQWKWHAANNFGTDSSGTACIGCGDVQEEFYSCSDIAIGNAAAVSTSAPVRPATYGQQTPGVTFQTSKPTLSPAVTYPPFNPFTAPTRAPVVTYPPFNPITRPTQSPVATYPPFDPITHPTLTPAITYPPFNPITNLVKGPVGVYPPFRPVTVTPSVPAATTFPTTAPATFPPFQPITFMPAYSPMTSTGQSSGARCYAVGTWQGNTQLDRYCSEQCPLGNCPAQFCACSTGLNTPTSAPTHAAPALPSSTHAVPALRSSTHAVPALRSSTHAVPALRSSTSASPPLTTVPPTPNTVVPPTVSLPCYGINSWQGVARLDKWCSENCAVGLCPAQNCRCVSSSAPQNPAILAPSPATRQPPSISSGATPTQQSPCRAVGLWAGQTQLDQWCTQTCAQFGCDPQYCSCSPPTPDPSPVSTGQSAGAIPAACYAVNGWAGVKQLDQWCNVKCHSGNCPPQYCACGLQTPPPASATPASSSSSRSVTTPSPALVNRGTCHAVNNWQGTPDLDRWCREECPRGNCPPVYCRCDP